MSNTLLAFLKTVLPACLPSTKTTDSRTAKSTRYLVHRDSGISLTAGVPATAVSVITKNGEL